jgi:hypothetical protein
MKHAYLILAHNEFEVLQRLLNALDDAANDVFIHIDAKVPVLPALHLQNGRLNILGHRLKTYWGDISLIQAEYELMKAALACGPYQYYHIISGTHYPILSREDILKRYDMYEAKSVLQKATIFPGEVAMKFGKYHWFITDQTKFKNILWRIFLKIQDLFPKRDTSHITEKASQWCSLCHDDVLALVKNEKHLLRLFRRTFCCDEFFIPSALARLGIDFVWDDKLTYLVFDRANPIFLKSEHYEEIMKSGCIFARKFNRDSLDLINKICRSTHS